jgi:hypothetical protein
MVSKKGIAETDRISVIAAGQLKRERAASPPGEEIHVSMPATIATIAAAIGASSLTLITTIAVAIDAIIRRLSRK